MRQLFIARLVRSQQVLLVGQEKDTSSIDRLMHSHMACSTRDRAILVALLDLGALAFPLQVVGSWEHVCEKKKEKKESTQLC
jgi:hypothetical protein